MPTPIPTPTPTPDLPTREATAIVYKIEADLIDVSSPSGRAFALGYSTVSARVDRFGSDYTWTVTNPAAYKVGDRLTVTVPA